MRPAAKEEMVVKKMNREGFVVSAALLKGPRQHSENSEGGNRLNYVKWLRF
jgi:hypothetical protein